MSCKTSSSARIFVDLLRPTRRRTNCDCIHTRYLNSKVPRQARHVSTAAPQQSEMEVDSDRLPRWATTPAGMKAPVRTRPERPTIKINTDQRKLDDVYVNFLGRDGHKLLSEETKWLAVTSKSFDHGRRGFNDRLAFFGNSYLWYLLGVSSLTRIKGKRIVELQCSLGLLSVSDSTYFLRSGDQDPHDRKPFRHPAIEAVECLSGGAHDYFTHHKAISNLATQYGLPEVVRWHPRFVSRLFCSCNGTVQVLIYDC